MKKIYLLLLICIGGLFLTGCRDNFQKSKECIDMTPTFEKKYNGDKNSLLSAKVTSVFYSPKLNTCIVNFTFEGNKEELIDGMNDKVIKYHFFAFETPDTLCTQEQRSDGCLNKDEYQSYIDSIK